VVAALWGLAAAWITGGLFSGDHSNAVSRWIQSITLLMVSAACTTLIVWLMQHLIIQPQNASDRRFELGYQAGRADALAEMRPFLGVVAQLSDRRGRTGA